MAKLYLVCLPVPSSEGDSDKTANKLFAQLSRKLQSIDVDARMISVPRLPSLSGVNLDRVFAKITELETTLLQLRKQLRRETPSDGGLIELALLQVEEFVWDAVEHPTESHEQLLLIPAKVEETVQRIMSEHKTTGSVLEGDNRKKLKEEKSPEDDLAEWRSSTTYKVNEERLRLLALRASAESLARPVDRFLAFVAAPEDPTAERLMRRKLQEFGGYGNQLSSDEWKMYQQIQFDVEDDVSENFPYLSIPFEM